MVLPSAGRSPLHAGLIIALPFCLAATACSGGGGGGNRASCPAAVVASWQANGESFQSSTSLYIPTDPVFNLGFVACVDDGNDRTIQFEGIPGVPPVAGTYPLKFEPLHGMSANGYAGAEYIVTRGTNYFTMPTGVASTGSLVITSVDSSARTLAGTFSFVGLDDSGTMMAEITSGTFQNVKYQ